MKTGFACVVRGGQRNLAIVALALSAGWTGAQPASTVVEVRQGDTFSAIAGRVAGNAGNWARLYDAKRSNLSDPNRILPGQRLVLVAGAEGKRYLRLMSGYALPAPASVPETSLASLQAPASRPELVIGVLPNISASDLQSQYDNLKAYLDRLRPSQPVRLVVPANFKSFFAAMMRGDFDLAVSAPHYARVAQLDAKLVPLVTYQPRIEARLVAPSESPVHVAADLRGKTLAFANPSSLVAMAGKQWLRGQGLEEGVDYAVKGARTDMGVGRMLLVGEADAAIMSNGEFRVLPVDESSRLMLVDVLGRIPNFILLGHPRLGSEGLARLKGHLLNAVADKDDGAAFARAAGISAIVPIDDATLREMDPYVATIRRTMTSSD
jgi:phosphonate transport system substrate-binding protein